MKYPAPFKLTVKCTDLFQYLHILEDLYGKSLISETNKDTYEIVFTAIFKQSLILQKDCLQQHYPTVVIVEDITSDIKDNYA